MRVLLVTRFKIFNGQILQHTATPSNSIYASPIDRLQVIVQAHYVSNPQVAPEFFELSPYCLSKDS